MRLRRTEPRPRISSQPALTMRERRERPRRRPAPRQGRAGSPSLMLTCQPAPQGHQVKQARLPDPLTPRVLEQRQDVAVIGTDRMPGKSTLRIEVPAELRQRRIQRRRQGLPGAVRSRILRSRTPRSRTPHSRAVRVSDTRLWPSHGQSVHWLRPVGNNHAKVLPGCCMPLDPAIRIRPSGYDLI